MPNLWIPVMLLYKVNCLWLVLMYFFQNRNLTFDIRLCLLQFVCLKSCYNCSALSRLMSSGSLVLLSPSSEDEGYFECTAVNDVGEERRVIEVILQGTDLEFCTISWQLFEMHDFTGFALSSPTIYRRWCHNCHGCENVSSGAALSCAGTPPAHRDMDQRWSQTELQRRKLSCPPHW